MLERFRRGLRGSGDVRRGSKRFRRGLVEVEKGMDYLVSYKGRNRTIRETRRRRKKKSSF